MKQRKRIKRVSALALERKICERKIEELINLYRDEVNEYVQRSVEIAKSWLEMTPQQKLVSGVVLALAEKK